MSSEFDTFANDFCTPAMVEQFGERDEQGDMQVIQCEEPGAGKPLELIGVIVGNLRVSNEVEDEQGTHVFDQVEDVVELRIPRQQLCLKGLYEAKTESKFVIPRLPGGKFTLLEVISETFSFSHVRCSRKHINRIQASRSERR